MDVETLAFTIWLGGVLIALPIWLSFYHINGKHRR